MKKQNLFMRLLLGAVVLLLGACSADMDGVQPEPEQDNGFVKEITATVTPIEYEGNNETRLTYSSQTQMKWSSGDVIGIFPEKGSQQRFSVDSKDDNTTTAHFDGGSWALRANTRYAAYYPFSWDNTGPAVNKSRLSVFYIGQKQRGMEDRCWDHLAKYDYMVAAGQETDKNGCINFEFQHLGAVVHFHIDELGKEVNLIRMLIKNDTPIMWQATYDITSATPALKALESGNYFGVDLEDVAIDANYGGDIWAMLPPCQLGGKLCLVDDEGNYYEGTLTPKTIEAGKGYDYKGVNSVTVQEVQATPNAVMISGADFNLAIKSLVNDVEINNTDFIDHTLFGITIKTGMSFEEVESLKKYSFVDLTDPSSPYPVYGSQRWQGQMFIYTSAKEIDILDGARMFKGLTYLYGTLDLKNINTSKVTDMTEMFYNCSNLNYIDFGNFNTAKVNTMIRMFSNCGMLIEIDLSSFDTSNVTDMSGMFDGCYELRNGTDFSEYPKFSTAKVEDMSCMFRNCGMLRTIKLNSFNTSNVRDMREMFLGCKYVETLAVEKFNTLNVTDMSSMFERCSELQNLDLSGWNTASVGSYNSMFKDCTNMTVLNFFPEFKSSATLTGMFSGMGSKAAKCTVYTSGNAWRMFDQSPEIALGENVELVEVN